MQTNCVLRLKKAFILLPLKLLLFLKAVLAYSSRSQWDIPSEGYKVKPSSPENRSRTGDQNICQPHLHRWHQISDNVVMWKGNCQTKLIIVKHAKIYV